MGPEIQSFNRLGDQDGNHLSYSCLSRLTQWRCEAGTRYGEKSPSHPAGLREIEIVAGSMDISKLGTKADFSWNYSMQTDT
jgi:hypothetical protein